MLNVTQQPKLDPIFAAIEAHRKAAGARYVILNALNETRDDAPELGITEDAHDKAVKIEVAATVKLRKTLPTTVAGVMAVATYFVEHRDRYPIWIGGEIASKPGSVDYPEARSFEDCLVRNLAAALRMIKAN
jgi:hypothetical protein